MMQVVDTHEAPLPALESLPRMLHAPERLERALRQLAQHTPLRARGAHARAGEPYGRTVLHRDAEGEVMLATWTGREASAPHDHGRSEGAVYVLEGAFRETCYRMERGLLRAFVTREHRPGSLVSVERDVIHEMEPLGPALTLHVYAPPVSCMRVFDRDRAEALTVHDECGAWIPSDVRLVTARTCFGALSTRARP